MGKDIRLNALRKKFQAYCHEENCKDIDVCPEECGCEKELDLDTAIAWNAALLIKNYSNNDPLQLVNVFSEYCAVLVYHKKKYEKLFDLILDAYVLLG